jgi:hypothetical protein
MRFFQSQPLDLSQQLLDSLQKENSSLQSELKGLLDIINYFNEAEDNEKIGAKSYLERTFMTFRLHVPGLTDLLVEVMEHGPQFSPFCHLGNFEIELAKDIPSAKALTELCCKMRDDLDLLTSERKTLEVRRMEESTKVFSYAYSSCNIF